MLKFITTKNVTYKGKLYRGRKIIGTEDTLALIYPLIGKAIFTSGWRSRAEQAEMVKKGVSKTMDSNHRRGVAYDIYNWKEMEVPMNKLGFINDLKPWDPGHMPLGGEKKARKNFPLIDTLPKELKEYKPKAKKPPVIVPEPPKVESEVHIPITIVKPPEAPPVVVQEPVKPVTFWELLWFDFKEFLTNFKQR